MAEQSPLQIVTPTIAGGASIATFGNSFGTVGTRGAASFELPLPVSGARHLTPALALQYNSQSTNDIFGIGMHLPIPSITRKTSKGVPRYDRDDVMVGPDGWTAGLTSRANQPKNGRAHFRGGALLPQDRERL